MSYSRYYITGSKYDRKNFKHYTNKFIVGDLVNIRNGLTFSYWSLDSDGTYEVVETPYWNKIKIKNIVTGKNTNYSYNTEHFIIAGELVQKYFKGDFVTWSQDGTSGWQGTRSQTLRADRTYIITDAVVDPTSGKSKYRIDEAYQDSSSKEWKYKGGFSYKKTWYSERHFDLKQKGNETVTGKNVKAIVLNEAGGIVANISTHDDACNLITTDEDLEKAINEKVGELLRKNPTAVFRVFRLWKTAKLPVITPVWE